MPWPILWINVSNLYQWFSTAKVSTRVQTKSGTGCDDSSWLVGHATALLKVQLSQLELRRRLRWTPPTCCRRLNALDALFKTPWRANSDASNSPHGFWYHLDAHPPYICISNLDTLAAVAAFSGNALSETTITANCPAVAHTELAFLKCHLNNCFFLYKVLLNRY